MTPQLHQNYATTQKMQFCYFFILLFLFLFGFRFSLIRFRYNLDLSLFERLVKLREAEFGKRARENGSLVTLSTQRRMRPEISSLIRRPLYPQLEDAPNVRAYPDVKGKQSTANISHKRTLICP